MPEQAKKWWTNRQTNVQTNQITLYPCCACAHGVIIITVQNGVPQRKANKPREDIHPDLPPRNSSERYLPRTFSLAQFAKKFSGKLPVHMQVSQGFYGTSNLETISGQQELVILCDAKYSVFDRNQEKHTPSLMAQVCPSVLCMIMTKTRQKQRLG